MSRSAPLLIPFVFALAACSSGAVSTTQAATSTGNRHGTTGIATSGGGGQTSSSSLTATAASNSGSTTSVGATSSTGTTGSASTSSASGTTAASTSGAAASTGGSTTSGSSFAGTTGGSLCGNSCHAGFDCDVPSGLCKTDAGVPQLTHVWILVMENTSYSDITSTNAPYLTNTVLPEGVLMDNYFAITHPSLPNYVAMVGGDTFGIASDGEADSASYQIAAATPNISTQLEDAGLTWHEYSESQRTACALSDTGTDATGAYASRHNPMPFYLITQGTASCTANDVSYQAQGSMPGMAADLDGGVFYNYVFISPNLCDDGHDSCAPVSNHITQQDNWLSANLDLIRSTPAYQDNGLVIVTWDEDDNNGGNNQIMTVLLSPMLANPGQPDGTRYSHYSALATIEAGFGLANLPKSLGHDDALITDLWK